MDNYIRVMGVGLVEEDYLRLNEFATRNQEVWNTLPDKARLNIIYQIKAGHQELKIPGTGG